MKKSQVHYMAVTMVSRLEDGRLSAWFPKEKRATLREANADAVRWSRECPGVEYQVVRVTVDEVGNAKVWKRGEA